jgi:uncharacterized protein (DUF1330 family)
VTVYAIAQLRIHDRVPYERYVAGFMPVLRQYGGRLVVADGAPEVTEGEWTGDRVVVLAFDDRDTFHTWFNSAEYQAIVKDRWAAAETSILLVRGVD